MKIIDFTPEHMEEAMVIAKANYEEERRYVPILPEVDVLPELTHFAENNLGVAAFDGDKMIGFLGAYRPVEDTFGTTGVRGTFSPIHAHGVIGEQRDRIYSRLYEAAAKKWVRDGIASHGIAIYAHDKAAIQSFFYNGFGVRCIDAIRSLEEIPVIVSGIQERSLEYVEVPRDDWGMLTKLHDELVAHLGSSPMFMKYSFQNDEMFYRNASEDTRYFGVKVNGDYIAYVKIDKEGETFASCDNSMRNICGAYCFPEYRGQGIYRNLIAYLVSTLKKEGYQRLGVDCESFNPNARGFWLKYFTAYTNSVVRRVDEKAVTEAIRNKETK